MHQRRQTGNGTGQSGVERCSGLRPCYRRKEKAGFHLGCAEKGVEWQQGGLAMVETSPSVSQRVALNKIWKEEEFHKAKRGSMQRPEEVIPFTCLGTRQIALPGPRATAGE